jgi:hypothetical protein
MPEFFEKHRNSPVVEALEDAIKGYENKEVADLAKFLKELVSIVLNILEDLGGEDEDDN